MRQGVGVARWFGLALLGCAACGGDGARGGDAGDAADAAGDVADAANTETVADGDSATSADAAEVVDTFPPGPLLGWPGERSAECSVTRAPAIPDPSQWVPLGLAVGPGDHTVVLGSQRGFGVGSAIFIAPLGLDGVLGTELVLDDNPQYASGAAVARLEGAHAGELLVAWAHMADDGSETLRAAVVAVDAASGALTLAHAGHVVDGVGALTFTSLGLLPLADGAQLVATASPASSAGSVLPSLRLASLTAEGNLQNGASVATLAANADDPSVVRTSDGGLAALWTASATGGAAVMFGRFAADGTPLGTARQLSTAGRESRLSGRGGGALIAAGTSEKLWAVWSEWTFNNDYQHPEGHSVLRLGLLDSDGVGPVAEVQAPENGIRNNSASFFVNGDHIALAWSRGAAIYICAGCFVDDAVQVLLLDPATLMPQSEVAVVPPVNGHGHSTSRFAVVGSEVLMASWLDFHALTRPATAALRCGPKAP